MVFGLIDELDVTGVIFVTWMIVDMSFVRPCFLRTRIGSRDRAVRPAPQAVMAKRVKATATSAGRGMV